MKKTVMLPLFHVKPLEADDTDFWRRRRSPRMAEELATPTLGSYLGSWPPWRLCTGFPHQGAGRARLPAFVLGIVQE